jgi:hypothetical protein
VWCDPRPPVESEHGPLTMDDLRRLSDRLAHALGVGSPVLADKVGDAKALARLRHAIEEVDRG